MSSYPEHAIMPTDADEEMADAANNVIGREGPWKVVWSAMAEVAVKRATSSPDAAGSGGEAVSVVCPACEGSGIGNVAECWPCGGSGKVHALRTDATQTREAELRDKVVEYFRRKDEIADYIDGRDRRPPIVKLAAAKEAEAVLRAALNARGGA